MIYTGKYCWSWNGEVFHGSCDTAREAVLEALVQEPVIDAAGMTLYLGEEVKPEGRDLIAGLDLVDIISGNIGEITGGEVGEDYPLPYEDYRTNGPLTRKFEKELYALLAGWLERNYPVDFGSVENIRTHIISREECEAAEGG